MFPCTVGFGTLVLGTSAYEPLACGLRADYGIGRELRGAE